jgi:hypothetical protein
MKNYVQMPNIFEANNELMPIAPSFSSNGSKYYDARLIPDDDMAKVLLRSGVPIRFDWENKWLRGEQYAHMLNNIDAYSKTFSMPKLPQKHHPENIYVQPESKCLPFQTWQTGKSTLSELIRSAQTLAFQD